MNVFIVYKKKDMQKECNSALIMKPAWEEILSKFNEEIRNEVYNAVVEYKGGGILPSLSPLAKMAFTFIKMEKIKVREVLKRDLPNSIDKNNRQKEYEYVKKENFRLQS